jgi:hypothetical protein
MDIKINILPLIGTKAISDVVGIKEIRENIVIMFADKLFR